MRTKRIAYILLVTFGLFFGDRVYSQITINEFQAYNASDFLDQETGNYSDWLELYNGGSSSINLNGYSLSNDINDLRKWVIPSGISIPAGGYLILWADKLDRDRHMNFSIKGKGGQLILCNSGAQVVDSLTYGPQISNISFGRTGSEGHSYFLKHSTPGLENSIPLPSLEMCIVPEVQIPGGFYNGDQVVILSNQEAEAETRYTLDGSNPTKSSILYTEPIIISKTTVLRAVSFKGDLLPSKVVTHTYFIDEVYSLPVVSIVSDNENIWSDDLGIYTQGNCAKDWERPANIELFDTDGNRGFSHQVGMNIHGGYNQILPMKSLAIRARNKYETDEINYKLFKDKNIEQFTSFILRNSGNDWAYSMFRDALMQNIVKARMDIDYQEYQPSIVFINGEYWGIHNIREKMNEYFMENNHNVDSDSVDILEKGYIIAEGSDSYYRDVLEYMSSHDMRPDANYSVVQDMVDIVELNNYQIAQIFFKNQDWPKGNIKKWRPQEEDGKWRWLLYDTDWGFGLFQDYDNMVEWTIAQNKWYLNFNTQLFRNAEYKYDFLQCFQSHLNTTFQAARVIEMIDSLSNGIEAEIPGHISRWGEPQSVSSWQTEVDDMKEFAINRPVAVKSELSNYFYLRGEYLLSLNIEHPSGGTILINHVDIPDNFSGTYFKDIPITVKAEPAEGFYFIGWTGADESDTREIRLTLSSDASLTAHFAQEEPLRQIQFNELSSNRENSIVDESGDSVDWIEIINTGEKAVNLTGLYLSDSIEDLSKHMIQNGSEQVILQPDSVIIFYADSDEEDGFKHLNFKLSNKGETLVLSQRIGNEMLVLDSVSYSPQILGITNGRLPDGEGNWNQCQPTPGDLNKGLPSISGLYINEFSPNNKTIVANEFGEFCDWIEIHNTNDTPIDLGGLFLTDSLQDRTKSRIPLGVPDSTTVPANGYLLLWADNHPEKGVLHLNFGLRRSGEEIGLAQRDGLSYIDSLSYDQQYLNSSMSRFPDGSEFFMHLLPSPLSSNKQSLIAGLKINEFSASNNLILKDEFGESDDWIEIINSTEEAIDVGGLFVTDSLDDGTKHRIPTTSSDSTTIQPGGYLLLWADNNPGQGVLHLDFKLNRNNGDIGIIQHNGIEVIDSISYNEQYSNSSLSLNKEQEWLTVPPTPGYANYDDIVSGIQITEFSASNDLILHDDFGEFDDWIEIYNDNEVDVDLGGLFITDSLAHGMKYRIPSTAPDSTTIQAKDYLILWADNNPDQGVLHLDFKLSRKGGGVGLLQYDGKVFMDSVTYDKQYLNSSLSICSDKIWEILPATPRQSNYKGMPTNIYINEFSASNDLIIKDEYGEYNDWIELYNGNDMAIDMGGLYLTDSLEEEKKFRIPTTAPDSTTIPAQGYLLLWADKQSEQGVLHLDFGLSKKGEQIGLTHYNGIDYIDSLSYSEQITNSSLSRFPDGENNWIRKNSTPWASNSMEAYSGIFINEFKAGVTETGIGDSWIELFNSNEYVIDVGGLYLTNSFSHPGLQKIPDSGPGSTSIPPHGFLIFGTNPDAEYGGFQLEFNLNTAGGEIGLSRMKDNEFEYLDSVTYNNQDVNFSTGRFRDGLNHWSSLSPSTPGKSNTYIVSSPRDLKEDCFSVYPNPVSSEVLYFSQIRSVALYNLWGSCVKRREQTDHLDLKGFATGLYFLQTDQGETLRIIIQ